MAICETCGAKYKPTPEAPECPGCAAGTPASEAPPAPAPAPHPRAAAAAPSAGPARPASAPRAAAPAARPAAAAPAARPAAAAAPAARPAAARAPAPAARAPAARAPAPAPKPVRHAIHDPNQISFDKPTKIGFGIVGGLVVIAAIVLFSVKSKKARLQQEEETRVATLTAFLTKLETTDFGSESSLKDALAAIDRDKATWKDSEKAADVMQWARKFQAAIDNQKQRADIMKRVDIVKERMAKPDELVPAQMKELKNELAELDSLGAIVGDKIAKEIAELNKSSAHVFAQQYLSHAEKLAASGGEPRVALRAAQFAEDQIYESLTEVARARLKDEQAFYEPIYKSLIALNDKLAYDLFGAGPNLDNLQGTEPMGFKDLLSDSAKSKWNPTSAKGFSWNINGGVMQIVGPDADEKKQAILAIGDAEQWRHFMLQMEFTIESGNFDAFFRLGRQPDSSKNAFYPFVTNSDTSPYSVGKTYQVRIAIMGSKMQVKFHGDDDSELLIDDLHWTKSRHGAIGLVIPPGTRMRISEFKIREFN